MLMSLKPFDVFQLLTVVVHKLVQKAKHLEIVILLAKHDRFIYCAIKLIYY
jgi:hypothetical protein